MSDSSNENKSLTSRAFQASGWIFSGFGMGKALQLLSNLILTRLLVPEFFGIMAIANVVVLALASFSDTGAQTAVIQSERGKDTKFLQTAWTVQVIRGLALCIVTLFLAWPISKLYGHPELFPILSVLAVTSIANGFQSIGLAIRARHLKPRQLIVVQVVPQILGLCASASFALLYQSVWALVAGAVTASFSRMVLSHILAGWHAHKLFIEKEALRYIFSFGRWVFGATLLTFVGAQGLQAVQGLLVTAEELGFLYISALLAWGLGELVSKILNSVVFPALSESYRKDASRQAIVVGKVKVLGCLPAVPLFLIISYFSHEIVSILYDARYDRVADFLAIQAVTSSISILPIPYTIAMLARGDSKFGFYSGVLLSVLRVGGVVAGFYFYSTLGMLYGLNIATAVYTIVVSIMAHRRGIKYVALDLVTIGGLQLFLLLTVVGV